MKQLILDYSTWRCGGDNDMGEKSLGTGYTALLNKEGFMCCLGQFSKQLNPEITDKELLNNGEPSEVSEEIPFLNFPVEDEPDEERYLNSELSDKAIKINDDAKTTIDEKITELKKLFESTGYEIVVRNRPNSEG